MHFKKLLFISLSAALILTGCGDKKEVDSQLTKSITEDIDLNKTIGALGEIYSPSEISVEGYGIVAGLNGKGSSECPPKLREYLTKYIQQMLGNANRYEALQFLNSTDSAVVHIYGRIPAGATTGSKFDLAVEALSTTQTTSLSGGVLYTSDLTASSRLGVSGAKKLAIGKGAVFIDWNEDDNTDERKGLIIGGGIAYETSKMYIELNDANYKLSGIIRNRINERFGEKTAKARSSEIISLSPPERYAGQHKKFSSLVSAIYLPETNDSLDKRIEALTEALKAPEDKIGAEMGLEAIGRMSLRSLRPLLDDEKEEIRLRAARCMLNIGYEKAINTLIQIAYNADSQKRIEAVEAIRNAPVSKEALSPLRRLLSDADSEVRLAAYEILRDNGDMSISRQMTMAGFTINTVISKGNPLVYVYRQDRPQIVLFGNDIKVQAPLFVKNTATDVTINAASEGGPITLMRQNPTKPGIIGPLESSDKLTDIIFKLTDNIQNLKRDRSGLGVDYSGTAVIIKELADSGNLNAEFKASPIKEIKQKSPSGLPGKITENKN
ncbi:MAG: flagellar basal body P-ring protein FlgI [Sedimentisphaeraceae bacterium JB056]